MSLGIDILVHAANLLYLFAFMVRDILWLRVLTVVASFCLVAYFYFQPVPLVSPIYWNIVFTALNVYWIVRLLMERRPVRLTLDEEVLCELVFRTMTPREMTRLLGLATWQNATAGECFLHRGEMLDSLMVIFSGKACVEVDGRSVAELRPGQFIGSLNYVTEETAPTDIVALEPTRYISWPKAKLQTFMKENPDLHSALKTTLAIDLARWLRATWEEGSVIRCNIS
jgi:hypothetical protein